MSLSFKHLCGSACIIAGLASAAHGGVVDYYNAVMADSPEAYWTFEDGNDGDVLNGSSALDWSGNMHHGTYTSVVTDGPQLISHAGFGGLAAHFMRGGNSQEGDFISFDTLGDVGSNIDDNGVTFEFLLKNQQTDTDENRVFGVWNERPSTLGATRSTMVTFTLNRGLGTEVFVRDEADDEREYEFDDSVVDINDGKWHHIAWVVPPGGNTPHKVYVDGIDVTLTETLGFEVTDFVNFDKEFIIGGDNRSSIFTSPDEFLIDAMVDEFAVYSGVLSAERVRAHAEAAGLLVPEPGALLLLGLGSSVVLASARKRVCPLEK